MADFTADFEAGVNGNAVTDGVGEASATAWTAVSGTIAYDNAQVAHGLLAAKYAAAGTNTLTWDIPSTTDYYGRIYLYRTGDPAQAQALVALGGNASIKVWTDGTLYIDAGTTQNFTIHPATNAWCRIEWHVIFSATVGQIEAKLFNDPNSSSPTETQTSPASWNTGAASTSTEFTSSSWGSNVWLDDIVSNAVAYPGPVASFATYTILNGSDEQLVNINAGGTDVDAASYKNGVTLSDSELEILLDGTSFGKKNVAVLPDLTGVADARQIKKTTFSAETESA